MNPVSILPDSESEIGLYYIVPFSQLYLYQTQGNQLHLYIASMAFLATIGFHTYLRSILGPGLDESDISDNAAFKRRSMTALYGNKKPHAQPDNHDEAVADLEFSFSRAGKILSFFILMCSFFIIYLYSLYVYWQVFQQLELLGQMTAFGLIFPVLESITNSLWTSAYQYPDEIPEISDRSQEIVNEFTFMFKTEEIELNKMEYNLEQGGIIKIDYSIKGDTKEEIKQKIYRAGFAYCGFVERFDYPTAEFRGILRHNNKKIAKFKLEENWVVKINENELSNTSFIRYMDKSITFGPNKQE